MSDIQAQLKSNHSNIETKIKNNQKVHDFLVSMLINAQQKYESSKIHANSVSVKQAASVSHGMKGVQSGLQELNQAMVAALSSIHINS